MVEKMQLELSEIKMMNSEEMKSLHRGNQKLTNKYNLIKKEIVGLNKLVRQNQTSLTLVGAFE